MSASTETLSSSSSFQTPNTLYHLNIRQRKTQYSASPSRSNNRRSQVEPAPVNRQADDHTHCPSPTRATPPPLVSSVKKTPPPDGGGERRLRRKRAREERGIGGAMT
ncbi:hypothetical protein Hanom_Chr00s000002g01599801 [Helianthus anomalus]